MTIAWEHSSYTVQERDGMVHLRALMYGATDLDVSVSVTTSDGTALGIIYDISTNHAVSY